MLETLDRGNLFLVPLDDRRQWYRYHRLFADVLQAHLNDQPPERIRRRMVSTFNPVTRCGSASG